MEDIGEQVRLRRQWFVEHLENVSNDVRDKERDDVLFSCPCCGYPTLTERCVYEICYLCNWEDDGQDDPRAADVYGGPNGSYSLAQARHNFDKYLVMYEPENDTRVGGEDSPVEKNAKRAIVASFDKMQSEAGIADVDALWSAIRDQRQVLSKELDRKVGPCDVDEYDDTSAYIAGELAKWPSKEQMVSILRNAGLNVYVGKFSIRIEDCSHFVLQEYGGDIGDPSIDADADSTEQMMRDAKLVSDALATADIVHRFEIYDHRDEMVGYQHHDWPVGK